MSAPDLRPTFVAVAYRRSPSGALLSAVHRRLRASSLLEAEAIAIAAFPGQTVTVRAAERLDDQMWIN